MVKSCVCPNPLIAVTVCTPPICTPSTETVNSALPSQASSDATNTRVSAVEALAVIVYTWELWNRRHRQKISGDPDHCFSRVIGDCYSSGLQN
jgi:hypothetical protein